MTCGPEIVYLPPDSRVVMRKETKAMLISEQKPAKNVKSRFLELLEQHPELTLPQAYMLAVMEVVGYRGYLVPPELAPGVLARLENNDNTTRRL